MREKCIFSACLVGVDCKYNGKNNFNHGVFELWRSCGGVLVCPEQLGGLSTPRAPSTIIGGDGFDVVEGRARVINADGLDVTENFLRGAKQTLMIALSSGATIAYFVSGSPSCGCGKTNISWERTDGIGVASAILIKNSLKITEV